MSGPESKKQKTMDEFVKPRDQPPDEESESSQIPEVSSVSDDDGSSQEDKDNQGYSQTKYMVQPGFKLDSKWSKYFEYSGHSKSGGMQFRCKKQGCSRPWVSIGKTSKFNAVRHYEVNHEMDIRAVETANSQVPSAASPFSLSPAVLNKRKDKQEQFDFAMLKLIAQDGVTLSLPEKKNFRSMVQILDPHVKVLSRRTYGRNLIAQINQKVLPAITDIHSTHRPDLMSYSLDIWTSRMGASVMGTRCHYIDSNWELVNRTIGFQEFQDRHTGDNIRSKFRDLLTSFNSNLDNTHYVVTDNAANMIKAFNLVGVLEDPWVPGFVEELQQEEDEAVQFDDDEMAELDFGSCSDSEDDDDAPPPIRPKFLGCLAHTLQLVINAALQKDPVAILITKYLDKISAFFRRRSHWRSKLKSLMGRELIKPVKTRWNSLYFSLNRLCEEGVLDSIHEIGREIKVAAPKVHEKFPKMPIGCTLINLRTLLELLNPIQLATDRLQSEKCSISSAIISICVAFECIAKTDAPWYSDLKSEILTQMKDRLEQKVLNSDAYILTSFLDPRCKDSIFKETWFSGDEFPIKLTVPDVKHLRALLDVQMQMLKNKNLLAPDPQDSTSEASASASTGSIFSRMRQHAKSGASEIERYIQEGITASDTDPLLFWKIHGCRFPNLALMAKKYLCIPATSGGVERLFSIAGSLGRARRASMTMQTMGNLIIFRDFME